MRQVLNEFELFWVGYIMPLKEIKNNAFTTFKSCLKGEIGNYLAEGNLK